MACNTCGQVGGLGCTTAALLFAGRPIKRLRFGEEDWYDPSQQVCSDCGVAKAGLHHWECTLEQCSACGERDCAAHRVPAELPGVFAPRPFLMVFATMIEKRLQERGVLDGVGTEKAGGFFQNLKNAVDAVEAALQSGLPDPITEAAADVGVAVTGLLMRVTEAETDSSAPPLAAPLHPDDEPEHNLRDEIPEA